MDLWRLSGPTSLSRQGHLEPRTLLCPDILIISKDGDSPACLSSLFQFDVIALFTKKWQLHEHSHSFLYNTSENKTWPGTGSLSGSD